MPEYRYRIIPVEGPITEHVLTSAQLHPTYQELRSVADSVGIPEGYMEHVTVLDDGVYKDAIVHEDGRREGHQHNPRASKIYWANAVRHQGASEAEMHAAGFDIVGPFMIFDDPGAWT